MTFMSFLGTQMGHVETEIWAISYGIYRSEQIYRYSLFSLSELPIFFFNFVIVQYFSYLRAIIFRSFFKVLRTFHSDETSIKLLIIDFLRLT